MNIDDLEKLAKAAIAATRHTAQADGCMERSTVLTLCDVSDALIARIRALEAALTQISELDKFGGYNTACDIARRALRTLSRLEAKEQSK